MPLSLIPLIGHHVRLEPISTEYRDGLIGAATDGRLWELKVTTVPTPEEIDSWIDSCPMDAIETLRSTAS